jgi:hypothetical protein
MDIDLLRYVLPPGTLLDTCRACKGTAKHAVTHLFPARYRALRRRSPNDTAALDLRAITGTVRIQASVARSSELEPELDMKARGMIRQIA